MNTRLLFLMNMLLFISKSLCAQSALDLYGTWNPTNFILTLTSDASDKILLRKKCLLSKVKISENKIEVFPKGACLLNKTTELKISGKSSYNRKQLADKYNSTTSFTLFSNATECSEIKSLLTDSPIEDDEGENLEFFILNKNMIGIYVGNGVVILKKQKF